MSTKRSDMFLMRELNTFESMTEMLRKEGIEFQNVILKQEVIEANYYISKQLNVPLATKVFYLERLRVIEGNPCSIEKIYICFDRVNGLEREEIGNQSFYCLLEKNYGYRISKSREEILIVEANECERELLALEKGEEVLLIKGNTFLGENTPFEYFELASLPSLYRFRSVTTI